MKAVLVNYNYTPDWLLSGEYDFDYIIADRSDSKEYLKDFPQERIRYTKNVGNVDYDKLTYLVERYDDLPEIFLWGKTNLFKYITKAEFDAALQKVKEEKRSLPLLTQGHKTYSDKYGPVCYYQDGMYWERNDSWYFNVLPHQYRDYYEFAQDFHLPSPPFLCFNPGGNWFLSRAAVHTYARDYYERMLSILPYCQNPAEAHALERSYYTLWRS